MEVHEGTWVGKGGHKFTQKNVGDIQKRLHMHTIKEFMRSNF